MKRDEKIKIFKDNIGTYNTLRCFFNYNSNYFYFYGVNINNKLIKYRK